MAEGKAPSELASAPFVVEAGPVPKIDESTQYTRAELAATALAADAGAQARGPGHVAHMQRSPERENGRGAEGSTQGHDLNLRQVAASQVALPARTMIFVPAADEGANAAVLPERPSRPHAARAWKAQGHYAGLEVTPEPPHRVVEVDDLVDEHFVSQGASGYSNPAVRVGDRILAVDGLPAEHVSVQKLHGKLRARVGVE
jgi:hypothetical protein